MIPYYQDSGVTIYYADCSDLMPIQADAVITDPPYEIGKAWKRKSHGNNGKSPLWGKDQKWDKLHPIVLKLTEWYMRVIIWGGNHYVLPAAPHWMVWDKLQSERGADCELAWTRGLAAHKVWRMSRIDAYVNKADCKKEHPTQKPTALMIWCIEHLKVPAGGTIIDCYMGSGSTLVAAKRLGYRAIGIDNNEKYCEIAAKRCSGELIIDSGNDASFFS